MTNYQVDLDKKWDYENGFYLTCETSRVGKFLNHLEIYNKITHLHGDILEFGVYKGTSLVRLLAFRDLIETSTSRKIYGFDMFGKFPNQLELECDREFVKGFESAGGYGISKEHLEELLKHKGVTNYELIKGDILETIPTFINENEYKRFSMIHIDVDVYEPTKFILETLWSRLVKGGILMLDDYGTVNGETKAVDEFFKGKDVTIHKPKFNYIPSYIIK